MLLSSPPTLSTTRIFLRRRGGGGGHGYESPPPALMDAAEEEDESSSPSSLASPSCSSWDAGSPSPPFHNNNKKHFEYVNDNVVVTPRKQQPHRFSLPYGATKSTFSPINPFRERTTTTKTKAKSKSATTSSLTSSVALLPLLVVVIYSVWCFSLAPPQLLEHHHHVLPSSYYRYDTSNKVTLHTHTRQHGGHPRLVHYHFYIETNTAAKQETPVFIPRTVYTTNNNTSLSLLGLKPVVTLSMMKNEGTRTTLLSNLDARNSSNHNINTNNNNNNDRTSARRRRRIEPMTSKRRLQRIMDSEENDRHFPPIFETSECKAQYDWQLSNLQTCNHIHELDRTDFIMNDDRLAVRHLGSGFWRDAWVFNKTEPQQQQQQEQNTNNIVILKTMRYPHDHTQANLDRHRRDAMTAEHLTVSPHIVDIYAYCGTSGFFQYGDGGDLEDYLGMNDYHHRDDGDEEEDGDDKDEDHHDEQPQPPPSLLERFHIAVQAASGLATLHNFDREGHSGIAHADITVGQYIRVNGTFKLNDFNRARFIAVNQETNKACPYHIGNNPGIMRSPEEYNYEAQTEKVDIYSLGNVLYVLLMLEWPFYDISADDDDDVNDQYIADLVIDGHRPHIPDDVWHSSDPIHQALIMAIRMCFEQDPTKRASARQVERFLLTKLHEIDPAGAASLFV